MATLWLLSVQAVVAAVCTHGDGGTPNSSGSLCCNYWAVKGPIYNFGLWDLDSPLLDSELHAVCDLGYLACGWPLCNSMSTQCSGDAYGLRGRAWCRPLVYITGLRAVEWPLLVVGVQCIHICVVSLYITGLWAVEWPPFVVGVQRIHICMVSLYITGLWVVEWPLFGVGVQRSHICVVSLWCCSHVGAGRRSARPGRCADGVLGRKLDMPKVPFVALCGLPRSSSSSICGPI